MIKSVLILDEFFAMTAKIRTLFLSHIKITNYLTLKHGTFNLRRILSQLRPQIQGLSQEEAANKLIHFVQYAFEYATDGEQHQYEKSYFFEENFYYPKNDCEDRAIFYAYLVKHLLGLDVHLIQYPGHECTAVNFTNPSIKGDGYMFKGKRFVICDPTYIGATIGMCMPDYKNITPMIELWY